ncbi:hypothetical protein Zmor_024834 [Zophobas morio]|uniref:Diphosphomevalonate decarboxylase n=1 Tax=Zophobas morio TaxID=2755281 RepID=A0AA38HL31_9CUCU|nr:hypothetical protein Zmor_024834 [Zophobas morio]
MVFTKLITCSGPVNIAVIKYWGKRNEELILPSNSSLSATLNQKELKTVTSVMASESFSEDRIWLNKRYKQRKGCHDPLLNCKLHICSQNNFPTAAGLASSASGYATLVFAMGKLFDIPVGELSQIARLGSGSACRSMFGGWVKWEMGEAEDGRDCKAVQTHDECHWPDIRLLVLVVSDTPKETSSTSGMASTVKTSELFQHRVNHVVTKRLGLIEEAITQQNFPVFAQITMQESNQFHAVCLDTYPPIFYMNDVSKSIVDLVTQYNAFSREIKAAYTFDAGPNAVIYTLKESVAEITSLLLHFFPPSTQEGCFLSASIFLKGFSFQIDSDQGKLEALKAKVNVPRKVDALRYILLTSVGDGPRVLSEQEHLLSPVSGLPK